MKHELLEKIKAPEDVKNLPEDRLPQLAEEVRDVIISTVSQNGGHLASNLGVVELTIALHRVFNSPQDKIIWDVGHQVYTHKLLTGRYEDFKTLRQKDGLSGFSRPNESEHDIVFSGHSSVSISTAMGIAAANKVNGKKDAAIAVLGDGALTGGLVYEALNNTRALKDTNLIIILNDNGMSISKNVGNLAKRLAVMRSTKEYFQIKSLAEKIISKIPFIGVKLADKILKAKTDIKNIIYGSNLFEDLGVRYMGPIDGHNIDHLCEALEGAKNMNHPVLLHINTIKGKGFGLAEENPTDYHGVAPFVVEKGLEKSSNDNFSEQFGDFLYNQAAKDKRICAITAAMMLGTGLQKFSEEYKDRFFDVGIAEEHAIPYSLGLAKNGMVPVFVVYSTFLQRCYDQIMHDFALQQGRMIIAVDRAGIVGDDGETHNGIYDAAMFNGVPNILVYSPAYYSELKKDFVNALYHSTTPVVVRYPRGSEPYCPDDFVITGNAYDIYGDENAEYALVTYGRIFGEAAKAYKELKAQGISVKIIKLNEIIPISTTVYEELENVKKVYFFEEGVKNGGIGETFGSYILENGLAPCFKLVAFPDCFVKQGKVNEILHEYQLDCDGMCDIILKDFGKAKEDE